MQSPSTEKTHMESPTKKAKTDGADKDCTKAVVMHLLWSHRVAHENELDMDRTEANQKSIKTSGLDCPSRTTIKSTSSLCNGVCVN
jgi:hypothetical protein